jgi:hypothetical protein
LYFITFASFLLTFYVLPLCVLLFALYFAILSCVAQETYKSYPPPEELFPSVRRRDDAFAHEPHIGAVTAVHSSPFHRNLFLTAGNDGALKLFHMLERQPLRVWEPTPGPGIKGTFVADRKHLCFVCSRIAFQFSCPCCSFFFNHFVCVTLFLFMLCFVVLDAPSVFSPISAASFSPIRPLLIAAASSDGFVYLYDLGSAHQLSPVCVLECKTHPPAATVSGVGAGAGAVGGAGGEIEAEAAGSGSSRRSAGGVGAAGVSKSRKHSSGYRGGGGEEHPRVSVTGLVFNHKQRGMIAACDYLGRVHIWKLTWKLSNMHPDEQRILDEIGNINNPEQAD